MKEKIEVPVICDKNPDDHTLEIISDPDSDVVDFFLDGQQVFGGDWSANFARVFKRALEIWGDQTETES